MFLRHALEEQRRKAGLPEGDWRVLSAEFCEGPRCGAPLPEERRRAVPGVRYCVHCQERRERRTK